MMELISGNSSSVQQQMAAGNNPPNGSNGQIPNGTAERLLADFFDTFPSWDMTAARAAPPPLMQPLSNEM